MSADRDYLAAGLALGGLSEDDLAEARTLADTDAEFRAEVDAYADTVALMAFSDEPQTVSEECRTAILALPDTVAQEDPDSPVEAGETPAAAERGPSDRAGDGSSAAGAAEAGGATGSAEVGGATGAVEVGGAIGTRSSREADRSDEPIDLADRRRRRTWLPWAAAAAAIIVIAGFGVSTWQSQQRQSELEERLAQTQQQLADTSRLMGASDLRTSTAELSEGGSVTVVSSEAEQLIRVSSHGVEAASGTALQMWVIDADGPKSAGLMSGNSAQIDDRAFGAGSQFGITVEPAGGSDQPTSDPVVAVEL